MGLGFEVCMFETFGFLFAVAVGSNVFFKLTLGFLAVLWPCFLSCIY